MAAIHYTTESFNEQVLNGSGTYLIDFWAEWCGPCKALGPTIEELSDELAGKVVVGKVNVDKEPALARKYMVMSIPTVILIKDGKEINRSIGLVPKAHLLSTFGL